MRGSRSGLRDVLDLRLRAPLRRGRTSAATTAPVRRAAGEEEERERACRRPTRATGRSGGAERAADRDRGLADPEREPELGRGEPGHDRAAARGVDARAERSGADERGRDGARSVCVVEATTSRARGRR